MKDNFKKMKNKLIVGLIVCFILWLITSRTFEGLFSIFGVFALIFASFTLPTIIIEMIIKVGRKVGSLKRKVGQMDDTDFNFDKNYYREILEINSPLLLGCLDNFDIDKNVLIAQLLYMKEKERIKIEKGKIEVGIVYNEINVSASEKIILNKIKNGKFGIENYDDFMDELRKVTMKEAEKVGLLEKKKKKKKKGRKLTLIVICIIILLLIFWGESSDKWRILGGMLVVTFAYIMPLLIAASLGYNGAKIGHQYIRTVEGKKLNKKIDGLRRYLKDYSNLSERESKEIELWEDYLIYSVMFGQNEKVVEEYEEYIDKGDKK